MNEWQAAGALLTFFVAATLKGVTGLGFSTIGLALLSGFLELRVAIPALLLPSLASNLMVMVQARGFVLAVRRFWPMYLAALPGVAIGVQVLATADGAVTRAALGVVLVLYAAWALAARAPALGAGAERWLKAPVGLLNGLVNGVTGSQVVPVLPYLLSLPLDKNAFVQTINLSFTLSSLAMLALLGGVGLLHPGLLLVGLIGIAPVALGVHLGGRVRARLPESSFRRAVLVFLLVIGASLVLRAVL